MSHVEPAKEAERRNLTPGFRTDVKKSEARHGSSHWYLSGKGGGMRGEREGERRGMRGEEGREDEGDRDRLRGKETEREGRS